LKRRSDFQQVRKGARCATAAFVLEAKPRGDQSPSPGRDFPRFGFTVTRRVGKAVERNRIRRRLKAAVTKLQMDHARADFDYVLVARRAALRAEFDALMRDLIRAFARVHGQAARSPCSREPTP
jgi:ribonuclease P protein component